MWLTVYLYVLQSSDESEETKEDASSKFDETGASEQKATDLSEDEHEDEEDDNEEETENTEPTIPEPVPPPPETKDEKETTGNYLTELALDNSSNPSS